MTLLQAALALVVTPLDGLPLVLANGIGVVGVVFVVGWMVWTGRLVPRPTVEEERARHAAEMLRLTDSHAAEMQRLVEATTREVEDANHERGEWRTEARLKDQVIVEQGSQITALASGFGVVKDFLAALRSAGTLSRETEERST